MQNHGKRGRIRPSPNPRVGRMGGRGPPPSQQPREMFHGVYSDQCFTHVAAILKGCTVLLQVKSGTIYEGILTTVSSQAEIVLEAAHMLDQPGVNSGVPTLNKVSFKAATIVSITAKDVDPEFAVRGGRDALMTDAEIARRQNGQAGERELEEWQGATTEGDSLALDGSGDVHSNGWSAEEMFKTNESRYGVTSSYDDSLPEYTTSLDQSNPKVYQERKEKAERLAREMENSPQASGNVEADDITDEEDKFSAVSRSGEAAGNRYIPPHQRENTRGGHPPQHAPGPRRTQMQRMPGPGRPMSSPHHIHSHSPPHPHTQQVQGHPHGHPHQPMQSQQQPPIHMYPNQQVRLPQPGPQPSLPLQQQQAQHQQPLQHQQQQQQQQQQQLQKHHPPPQQQPAQVHLPSHGRTPPQQPGQTPPRVQPPTQLPSRPLGLGSQSPRSSPLPNTETSPSVREEKPHATVTEERQQQSTDDSSKRKPETNPPERTSESAPPAVPEKNHKNEKTIAELKEFRDTFHYENKPVEEEPTSIPSTQAASEAKAPTTTEKTTPTVPQPAEERETKDMDTSSGKDSPSNPNKDKDKQLNPLAKPFVPTFTRNHKTPTPPRPQLSPSPAMVLQHTQPYSQQPSMVPFVLSSGQGYQGAMPTPQQTAVAQAQQVSHMAPKPMMPKKGYAFASSATNIPHQRPQPPNELPTLIPNASMAAGQPLVSPMGYPHPSQMLHYPPQPGIPGQPMLPQAGPYQMYQAKHPVPYRPIQPQPSIQGVPQPTAAPHIHTLPEGNIPGNSPVLVSNTQLQAQAGQVQQSMHAQISHQQQQQQQAQQQQQQHAQQSQQQQQQQPQHHHHPQSVVHLQPQHQHPHAQPHTTPPQQQAHGSQPSQIPQPQQPPQQQQPQQQPQQQQQQQQHRPTPSPVHHMPHQQHQGHQPHVSQHQNMAHHLHPQSQQILYHQAQLQPGHLQSMAIQSSQPQQQQQFGGPHPYPQYITSTTIPATNITSVTPVHTNPHPHPTQANWMILPGQPMNPMVHNSGQMAAHLLPQPQGLGQAHGHVQAFQQGN